MKSNVVRAIERKCTYYKFVWIRRVICFLLVHLKINQEDGIGSRLKLGIDEIVSPSE